VLAKVSSHDIKSFVERLNELDGVSKVDVKERRRGCRDVSQTSKSGR